MKKALTLETAEYLLAYLRDEMLATTDRRAARAVDELTRYIDGAHRPAFYTLRREGASWRIGAGEGLLMPPPSGEIARGLGAIELAVAFPGEPVHLNAFLVPGQVFKSEHGLARKMVSVTRKWVGDEADDDLEILLAACAVTLDDLDRPVLTCARLPVPIVTSFAGPVTSR